MTNFFIYKLSIKRNIIVIESRYQVKMSSKIILLLINLNIVFAGHCPSVISPCRCQNVS